MIRSKHGSAREAAHAFFDACRRAVKEAGLDPDQTFHVFPFGGLGEFTHICSLLHLLRAEGPVALFVPENKTDFHALFPECADLLVHYPPGNSQILPELYHLGMRKPGYPFVPFTDWLGDGRFNMELVTKEGRLTLKEGYAYMLGLPLSSRGQHARIEAPANAVANLPANQPRVLIIPHANSHKPFAPEFWQRLTDALNHAGRQVYFETTSYAHAIPTNATALQLSIGDVTRSLSAFECTITLRSGLSDLFSAVAPAQRGKLAVLYHVTAHPLTEEQRFNHAAGVAQSGLALARIAQGDAGIRDIEINGDALNEHDIAQIIDFVNQTTID